MDRDRVSTNRDKTSSRGNSQSRTSEKPRTNGVTNSRKDEKQARDKRQPSNSRKPKDETSSRNSDKRSSTTTSRTSTRRDEPESRGTSESRRTSKASEDSKKSRRVAGLEDDKRNRREGKEMEINLNVQPEEVLPVEIKKLITEEIEVLTIGAARKAKLKDQIGIGALPKEKQEQLNQIMFHRRMAIMKMKVGILEKVVESNGTRNTLQQILQLRKKQMTQMR